LVFVFDPLSLPTQIPAKLVEIGDQKQQHKARD